MKKAKYQKLQLISFSIETGGGMNGGQKILRVGSDTENDIVTVYKSVKSAWHLKPRSECYLVDSSLLYEIKQIVIDEKLYNAPKVPLSRIQILDGDTTSYRIFLSDGTYLSYSSNQKLSSKIYNANDKIKAVIEKYCENATAYPTVYVEEDDDESRVFWKEQEGITVECSNNAPFQIDLNIYNGNSDKAILTGNVTVSKIDGNKVIYTDTLLENYNVEMYAKSSESVTVTLPFDRYREEGRYKMEFSGYETYFDMKIYKA